MSAEEKAKYKAATKQHQEKNREYWRELNRKSYQKWTAEYRASRLLKSNMRHKRLRSQYWDQELTDLVTIEAHDLRHKRKANTHIEWHVDHILPLNGKNISGLHVWNNIQVIPKVLNLQKGNKEMIKYLS